MGDTPKQSKSEAWRKAREQSSLSLERRNNYKRIEAVRRWATIVPAVLEPEVSIHAAAQRVMEANIHEGRSLRLIQSMIKLAREFQASSPVAWLDHHYIGQIDALRDYRAVINGYNPGVNDVKECSRIMELNRILEKAAALIRDGVEPPPETDEFG